MSSDPRPRQDLWSRLTHRASLLDCRNVAGNLWQARVEARLGWFESGDRRKVAVVITSDGRRVHVPIEPTGLADVSLLDILLSIPGLGGLLGLITGSRRDRGTRRDERR